MLNAGSRAQSRRSSLAQPQNRLAAGRTEAPLLLLRVCFRSLLRREPRRWQVVPDLEPAPYRRFRPA